MTDTLNMKPVTVWIKKEQHTKLRANAFYNKQSMSKFIREAIDEAFKQIE